MLWELRRREEAIEDPETSALLAAVEGALAMLEFRFDDARRLLPAARDRARELGRLGSYAADLAALFLAWIFRHMGHRFHATEVREWYGVSTSTRCLTVPSQGLRFFLIALLLAFAAMTVGMTSVMHKKVTPALYGDELIGLMADNPTLIQRPIGVLNGRAVLGRPPERLLELLE